MISLALMSLIIDALILFICLHVILSRIFLQGEKNRGRSRQALLIRLLVWMNLPLTIGVVGVAMLEARSIPNACAMWIYSTLVFNCFGYTYFHLFNLSETGRRVRMLIEIMRSPKIKPADLEASYSPQGMIEVRMRRLLASEQIFQDQAGRYQVKSRLLLYVARTMDILRCCLGFKHGK